MTKIFNKKTTKNLRKILRHQPISAERKLWQKLRGKKMNYKIHRQYGIGNYIVDFYCPKKKLVIEIDGATHSFDNEIKRDKVREKYLINLGLKIKRYSNRDVYKNIGLVVTDIYEELNGPVKD
jgi:very-short-patch-repair endonuclease